MKRPWPVLVKLLLVLAVVAALILGGRRFAVFLPAFADWVRAQGAAGPAVFIAGYVLATVAFIPGSALTLAAGAIFGLGRGVLYVFIGAAAGSAAAFLVSRHFARGWIEKRLAGNERFAAIDRAVGAEGRKIVFLLRLSPVVPFNLLNYALGLTRVRFVDYLVASIGMLPGTILYVYYGKLAGEVAALAGGGRTAPRGAGYYAVLLVGLAATVIATTIVTRISRRALSRATASGPGAGGR